MKEESFAFFYIEGSEASYRHFFTIPYYLLPISKGEEETLKLWKDVRGEILRLGAQGEARYAEEPALFAEGFNRAAAIVTAAFGEAALPALSAVTPDDTPLALSDEAAAIVPLLAAFYVFEDEDERKAVRWREDAYDLMTRFTKHKRGRARVCQGEDI